jgi:hypothetical protein
VEGWTWPAHQTWTIWSTQWRSPENWLRFVEKGLAETRARVIRGGAYDRWDLEAADGRMGSVRVMTLVEEHGAGKQFARFRLRPHLSYWSIIGIALPSALGVLALWDRVPIAAALFAGVTLLLCVRTFGDLGSAMAAAANVLQREKRDLEGPEGAPSKVEHTVLASHLRFPEPAALAAMDKVSLRSNEASDSARIV